jgi:hypothetical protein
MSALHYKRPLGNILGTPNVQPPADKMEAILADIDADRADGGGWCGFV